MLREPTLPELIRMNKLIRNGLRAAEFEAWWDELDRDGRTTLLYSLVYCAGCSSRLEREKQSEIDRLRVMD